MVRFIRPLVWSGIVGCCLSLVLVPVPEPEKQEDPRDGLPSLILPEDAVLKNVGGSDGNGLNVQTCMEVIARAQGMDSLRGFRDWCRTKPGGSYPQKNRKQIELFCEERKAKKPRLVEFYIGSVWWTDRGRLAEITSFLKDALRHGYWVMVTDSGGPTSRYKRRVATAVILCHLDEKRACLFDPNWTKPGERYEWIVRDSLIERMQCGNSVWALILVK